MSPFLKNVALSGKSIQVQFWGWAFELKYDSLPRLDFKGVICMVITDPPVAGLAYKIKHRPP
jgi:hypothetical protein